jgi:DNA-binding response OmpR family regulator
LTNTKARILVVEDDRKTAEVLALYLGHGGHIVAVEHDGARAWQRIEADDFDLLLLDVMLPGETGLELCRRVRAHSSTPVILLTARTLEEERIEGLGLGADDYICKPFSPREVVARVESVLRRVPPGSAHRLRMGALTLDARNRVVAVDDVVIDLTATEFALLHTLLRRRGQVFSRAQLLDALPGEPGDAFDRTIDAHIKNLRRKVGAQYIETVFGVGYRCAVLP